MAQVAVTGANGHLGGLLVRHLLDAGHEVRALVYGEVINLDGLDVDIVQVDTTNPDSLRGVLDGVQVLYNLAGRISLRKGDEALVNAVNVGGVANIIDAVAASDVERMVHFSSIHAFEHNPPERVISEAVPLVERDAPSYSVSKARGQRLVEAATARGEIDAVIIHPAGCIGPYDFEPSRMGQTVMDFYRGNIPVAVPGGFSWVDGRDVARAAAAAAEVGRTGERYIVAGHWLSVSDTAARLASLGGRSAPRVTVPMWVAQGLAPLAEIHAQVTNGPARFSSASLHALRHHQVIDDAKARSELGHDPRPIEDTFADTVAWFEDEGATR